MKKKEKILVVITIVLIGLLIWGFIYDRDSAVLERTIPDIVNSDDIELVTMKKYGMMLHRVAYEAKFTITEGHEPDEVWARLSSNYDFSGSWLSYEEFQGFADENLKSYSYIPKPAAGSGAYVMAIEDSEGHHVCQVMDIENGDDVYLYIYYTN